MNRMNGLIGFCLILLCGLLYAPRAEAEGVPCLGCKTTQDFRDRVSVRRPGTYYLYNLNDEIMQTWRVPAGYVPQSHDHLERTTSNKQAGPVQLANPPGALDELAKGRRIWVKGGNTLRPTFNVPHTSLNVAATNGRTIMDVVYDENLKAQIESQAADVELLGSPLGNDFWTAAADLLTTGTAYLGLRDKTGVTIRVYMEDGGFIDVRVDIEDTVGNADESTARSAGMQLVPKYPEQAVGDWVKRPGDDLESLAHHLERIGKVVEREPGVGRLIEAIACSPIKCKVIYVKP